MLGEMQQQVPEKYKQLMNELSQALSSRLGLDLKADVSVDRKGMLEGRIFEVNPYFKVEFSLLRISHQAAEPKSPYYEVKIKTEVLSGVNELAKYIPFTKSRRIVEDIVGTIADVTGRLDGKAVKVVVDRSIAVNTSYLVWAEAGAGAILGGIWGYLLTVSRIGELGGALVGGVLGGAIILLLAYKMLE